MNATLLLDASVWLAALDRDDAEHGPAAKLVAGAASGAGAVSALDLTLYEVANVAVVRWRSPGDAARLVELVRLACADRLVRADGELLSAASTLAAEHGLTVYDAAYAAAAARHGWQLVSRDAQLVTAKLALQPHAAAPRSAPAG